MKEVGRIFGGADAAAAAAATTIVPQHTFSSPLQYLEMISTATFSDIKKSSNKDFGVEKELCTHKLLHQWLVYSFFLPWQPLAQEAPSLLSKDTITLWMKAVVNMEPLFQI